MLPHFYSDETKNLVGNQIPMQINWPSHPFMIFYGNPFSICLLTWCNYVQRCEAELLPRLQDLGWKADPATSCSTRELCEAVEVMVDLHRALKDASGAAELKMLQAFPQQSTVTHLRAHMKVSAKASNFIWYHLLCLMKQAR